MNIEILFYTQVGSILAFIVALFVLYRLLICQKDATAKASPLTKRYTLMEKLRGHMGS